MLREGGERMKEILKQIRGEFWDAVNTINEPQPITLQDLFDQIDKETACWNEPLW